jgi:hypothetical protein
MGNSPSSLANLALPFKSLAEWHHKWRWSRRNIQKLRTADAVVVSHTKSGRTWLRVMISYLYHLEYGTPANEVISFDNLHALNPAIPRIYFTRDTNVPLFVPGRTHEQVASDKKVLFLLRDPRDAAVSFYFHVLNRASEREMIRKGIDPDARSLPLYEFVLDEKLGVSRVIQHYNRWLEEMKSLSHTLVVKYEDLRADPVTSLGRIIEFLDHSFRHEDLVKAVEFASFDSLSRKEKEGFFSSGRMRPADPEEAGSFKVRRGKVGGYRDYFTAEQNDRIDALVREYLHPFFGYS